MRAFDGQRSDNLPVKRTREQKERLLKELKQDLAGMKKHTSSVLVESVKRRILELKAELKAEPQPG